MTPLSRKENLCINIATVIFIGLIVLLSWMAPAKAAEPQCEPGDPLKCSVGLVEGAPAPYAGQLYTPKLALYQSTIVWDAEEVMDAAIERAVNATNAALVLEKQMRTNDNDAALLVEGLLQNRLGEAHTAASRSWYEAPALWYALGFVTGVVATVGVVYIGVRVVDAAN